LFSNVRATLCLARSSDVESVGDNLESIMKIILSVVLLLSPIRALSQSATVTNGVLFRTFMVKTDKDAGTIFSVDIDNREYWITAKHILTGKKTPPHGEYTQKTATVSILSQVVQSQTDESKNWVTHTFMVIDPGKDIDIVVLVSERPFMDNPPATAAIGATGATFGGDCEFVGFPYGTRWSAKFQNAEMLNYPFVKRCTISGRIASPETAVWVLDGINNDGFSGGPVVFRSGTDQRIFAVVSGYRLDAADVKQVDNPNGAAAHPKEFVFVNSGFIVAYDLQCVLDAIKKNPIGPLRPDKSSK
jgi:hypothetical protein